MVPNRDGDPHQQSVSFSLEQQKRFCAAIDKPADKYKGATFEKYQVRKPPAVFIIDPEGKVRYQDIPLAVKEALKTMLGGQ